MSWHPRRREDPLEQLLRWRRNVLVTLPGGDSALVFASDKIVSVQMFARGNLRGNPQRSIYVQRENRADLAGLHDGRGWNLVLLQDFLGELLEVPLIEDKGMQREAFTGFYSEKLRRAIRDLAPDLLRLWLMQATYAGPNGITDRSVRGLMEDLGWRAERVVDGLAALEALGLEVCVRRSQRDTLTNRILPNAYALHEELVLVARPVSALRFTPLSLIRFSPSTADQESQEPDPLFPSKADQALRESLIRDSPSTAKRFQNQESHKESDPRIPYQNQGPESHKNSPASEHETSEVPGADYANHWREGQDKQSKAARSATNSGAPATSPNPPSPPSLSTFTEPLANSLHEQVAQELYETAGNMPIKVARYLTSCYGVADVRVAIRLFREQPTGSIDSPGAWLRSLIEPRKKESAPEERTRTYTGGKYSSFIQS